MHYSNVCIKLTFSGPPSRPPLPHRLVSGEGGSTPPGPPPQRPLPPPPGQLEAGAARRDDRKPSTPPIRDQQRNSRIIQQPPPQQQRKPEDLDVLAAQLNELASSPRNQRGGPRPGSERQRVPSQEGSGPSPQLRSGVAQNGRILIAQPQPPPMVEDDDSSDDDEDDDELVQKDGTLQVNDPVPKPLRELQQRKGPGRPLPPTPDDDDTMRRAASGSQLTSGGIQRMDSSPGLANRGGLASAGGGPGQVMPDLLPQQSSGIAPPSALGTSS